ncbi:class I SAM-dependent methyltransferase [Inquilinus limosus]|uniref:class I SAM-dependent methyltransferase n=1 Tax=Inquilinus limosus TaxID=171674 RepID=UPI0009DC19C4|nr:class I SAM-dependent methyltransferase [Inquilinus limosus]
MSATSSATRSAASYERVQNLNRITRFLHSGRYASLLRIAGELSTQSSGAPMRALEIGCGTGTAVGPLLDAYDVDYLGIDHNPLFIEAARRSHGHRSHCTFLEADAADPRHYQPESADIVFALETLEHIPEGDVVRIVENVCRIVRPKRFVVTVPVEIGPAVWIKNLGSVMMGHSRQSGNFSQTLWAGLYRMDRIPVHTDGHLGFDWRWLAQTIRHNARMVELSSLPFGWLPRTIAPTILMVAEPR